MAATFRTREAAPAGPAHAVSAVLASVLSPLRMILSDASVEKRQKESVIGHRAPAGRSCAAALESPSRPQCLVGDRRDSQPSPVAFLTAASEPVPARCREGGTVDPCRSVWRCTSLCPARPRGHE
jgi:hypothetical protein